MACFGSDYLFKTSTIMTWWQHIITECHKRSIVVLSFGSDGDSRLLSGMQICAGLHVSDSRYKEEIKLIPKYPLSSPKIPSKWTWFCLERPCSVAYIQDIVHIAVKLKCRLLKPSIVLPMGSFVASVQHFRLLQAAVGKDLHGLREKDVDHKDKQNYDAVLNLIKAAKLLASFPDATGTRIYIQVMQCVIDSYLNKSLTPVERIECIWYATFFVRYWRKWIQLHPHYNLTNNFITSNAYMCIELNAHSLITLILTIRNKLNKHSSAFQPWVFGSQTCEGLFRAARSMTSIFSTVISFGMLGLV